MYSSITHATRAKNFCDRVAGCNVGLVNAPKNLPINGCAYALLARNMESVNKCKEISDKYHIKIRGVYEDDIS